ncbi:MAG TPA: S8 family peptidase [Longimicrobium sp.]|nr:S8 family peptidase [Longimicrobium sp.]
MEIKREWIEELIFGSETSRRFTQDTPVLPDVWIRYGMAIAAGRDEAVDLLLTPHLRGTAGELFEAVRDRLLAERAVNGRSARLRLVKGVVGALAGSTGLPVPRVKHPSVAYNQSTVVAEMYLDEVIRIALPLTTWWRQRVCKTDRDYAPDLYSAQGLKLLEEELRALDRDTEEVVPTGLAWLVRLVGTLQLAAERETPAADPRRAWDELTKDRKGQMERFRLFVVDSLGAPEAADAPRRPLLLFMVSQNREARPTIADSVQAMKADAAARLFKASCKHLAWAIVDSGIDATHGAFRGINPGGKAWERAFVHGPAGPENRSRVDRTFDFTRIRPLLSADPDAAAKEVGKLDQRLADVEDRLRAEGAAEDEKARLEHVRGWLAAQRKRWSALADDEDGDADAEAKALRTSLRSGRAINWDELRPFLEIPHEEELYAPPRNDHGTHVAGILAADWRREIFPPDAAGRFPPEHPYEHEMVGVCPDIRLFDFRVFDEEGRGDEFSVMAALQFLRHLNAQREVPLLHGVNLSLSIRHDVANFACGRTPVCEECERVVSSGMVVVAAAGNRGYNRFDTHSEAGAASTYEGYSAISITDPGNAEGVITVGATHRMEPHTYGVSYFSSRGPTGDGRYKPDLVAPGEKIRAPVPGNDSAVKDGTSMAAPHVSGAAALILARYREFIGRPARVKQVLCSTATDLGRDRYFQGSGMVDVLRALQSV